MLTSDFLEIFGS